MNEPDDLSGIYLMFSFSIKEEDVIFTDAKISTDASDTSISMDMSSVKLKSGDGLHVSISMKDLYQAIARALPNLDRE